LRIAWFSNSPDVPTGYGVQTMQVARRMVADGHEVHVLGNYGHRAGVRNLDGITVWPEGKQNYSLDVASEFARMVDAEVVFTLFDTWVMKDEWPNHRVISWTPIDHMTLTPGVHRWTSRHEVIAMAEHGAAQLRVDGIEPLATIPHGIERVYRPTPSDVRARTGIPDDAFLVMMNGANQGSSPPRKAWDRNIMALATFMARHEDAYLYLHTDLSSSTGVPIPLLIETLGMPRERIKVAPPFLYLAGLIEDAEMARLYTASDVLLAVSKGEGFGVPVIEAMGCGTPSIVADFSAQPELVGDTGWTVPGEVDFDWMQGSFWFSPYTAAIDAALEDAYQHKGERREACVERAQRFDADLLYRTHWRPLLEQLGAKPQRPGNTKSAKRRAAKAAA
jgi:glycosyltransferase involved in cell wall biosynthesis